MTKAPRRPAHTPVGGGALSIPMRRSAPTRFVNMRRGPNGRFAKVEAPATTDNLVVSHKRRRAPSPTQLVTRVTRAIERELSQIEDIVGGERMSAAKRTEAEKRARTLASLARTLSEVTRLRSAATDAKADHDDDAVPRDLDDFRRTLERRLAQMADPPEVGADRGDEPD